MDNYRNGCNCAAMTLAFLTGAAVGAVVGLLFAPRSGTETREKIREQAEEAREKLREKAQTARERAEEWTEMGKEKFSEARDKIHDSMERIKETIGSKKEEEKPV